MFENQAINTIENKNLSPWDIAITSDGIHVLNYMWDNKWIEADPNYKKVIIETIPTKNIWFWVHIVVLKWNLKN